MKELNDDGVPENTAPTENAQADNPEDDPSNPDYIAPADAQSEQILPPFDADNIPPELIPHC